MRRDEEGAGHRHLRVQSLILEELRALLRDDVRNPAIAAVRIMAVALSVDYRHAKVHFVLMGTDEPREVQRELQLAVTFLRSRLAEAIEVKRVPDLRFIFDGTAPPEEGGAACSE